MDFYSNGYALLLMPKGETSKKYHELIKKLAKENNGPVFEPHITLLGDIELSEEDVIKEAEELVLDQKPFQINLGEIGYEDYLFRAFFVKAVISPHLQNLHNRAKQIFNMEVPPYMAHLSLLYGNYPDSVKEIIIKNIGRDQSSTFEINSVFVQKAGFIKDWKVIKEFPFS